MSTYNGATYIEDQIKSIQNQKFKNWKLFVRDDGSSDETISIIRRFEKDDTRITLISDPISHRGIRGSFLHLLEITDSDYYMFCDQDDVWLPEKITLSLCKIVEIESQLNEIRPVLVCTDLRVVNQDLSLIHESMWTQNHIRNLLKDISTALIIAPLFQGCTMMFNNKAREKCLNIKPFGNVIHDNHLSLCVSATNGIISIIDEPLILYRQHLNNVEGAYRGKNYIFSKLLSLNTVYIKNKAQFLTSKHYLGISLYSFIYHKLSHLMQYH